VSEDNLLLKCN